MFLVTLEVLFVLLCITSLIYLCIWASSTSLLGYLYTTVVYTLLFSSILDPVWVRVGVVIYYSMPDPNISDTPAVVDLGLPEILVLYIYLWASLNCVISNYFQSICDGNILLCDLPLLSIETIIFLHSGGWAISQQLMLLNIGIVYSLVSLGLN